MAWTPEILDALLSLNEEALTAAEIAAALNSRFKAGKSRNAVIGKLNRMGVGLKSGGRSPSRRAARPKPTLSKARKVKTAAVKPRRDLTPVTAANFGRGVTLENIRDSQCRWPINNPDDVGGIRFCGQLADKSAVSLQARAYCPGHAAIIVRRKTPKSDAKPKAYIPRRYHLT